VPYCSSWNSSQVFLMGEGQGVAAAPAGGGDEAAPDEPP